MDDKDRLGDKLRDKGKAAEDLFIAEQERKRLERRKLAEAAAGSGACPKDGSKLLPRKEHGLTVDVCPSCQGIWLDKNEVEIALRQDSEIAVIQWVRSLLGR